MVLPFLIIWKAGLLLSTLVFLESCQGRVLLWVPLRIRRRFLRWPLLTTVSQHELNGVRHVVEVCHLHLSSLYVPWSFPCKRPDRSDLIEARVWPCNQQRKRALMLRDFHEKFQGDKKTTRCIHCCTIGLDV